VEEESIGITEVVTEVPEAAEHGITLEVE